MNLHLDYDSVGSKERNNEDTFEDIVLQLERYDKEKEMKGIEKGLRQMSTSTRKACIVPLLKERKKAKIWFRSQQTADI